MCYKGPEGEKFGQFIKNQPPFFKLSELHGIQPSVLNFCNAAHKFQKNNLGAIIIIIIIIISSSRKKMPVWRMNLREIILV